MYVLVVVLREHYLVRLSAGGLISSLRSSACAPASASASASCSYGVLLPVRILYVNGVLCARGIADFFTCSLLLR